MLASCNKSLEVAKRRYQPGYYINIADRKTQPVKTVENNYVDVIISEGFSSQENEQSEPISDDYWATTEDVLSIPKEQISRCFTEMKKENKLRHSTQLSQNRINQIKSVESQIQVIDEPTEEKEKKIKKLGIIDKN